MDATTWMHGLHPQTVPTCVGHVLQPEDMMCDSREISVTVEHVLGSQDLSREQKTCVVIIERVLWQ